MGLINQLEAPVQVDGGYNNTVLLTHECLGYKVNAYEDVPVVIWTVKGVVLADGTFKAWPGTESYAYGNKEDLAALLAANAETGKPANQFRLDDIQALYAAKTAPPQPA